MPSRGNFLASPSIIFVIRPAQESCSSWLCLFCSQNLSNRCLQTQIQKTHVLIHLALFHCVLPRCIPCFICTRSRKQQKTYSPARNSAGNTRGSLSLHCSQSLRRTCPKKLFVKHCSISRHSVSRHSAPRHPCSYTHGITNILKKSPGADQPNGRNLRHEPGAVQTNGRSKAELFEKTVRKNSSNSPCSASLHDAQHHSVHLYARVHTSIYIYISI